MRVAEGVRGNESIDNWTDTWQPDTERQTRAQEHKCAQYYERTQLMKGCDGKELVVIVVVVVFTTTSIV